MTDRCTFLLWTGAARGVPRQRRRATPGLRGRPHVCSVCATLPRVPRRNQPSLKKKNVGIREKREKRNKREPRADMAHVATWHKLRLNAGCDVAPELFDEVHTWHTAPKIKEK